MAHLGRVGRQRGGRDGHQGAARWHDTAAGRPRLESRCGRRARFPRSAFRVIARLANGACSQTSPSPTKRGPLWLWTASGVANNAQLLIVSRRAKPRTLEAPDSGCERQRGRKASPAGSRVCLRALQPVHIRGTGRPAIPARWSPSPPAAADPPLAPPTGCVSLLPPRADHRLSDHAAAPPADAGQHSRRPGAGPGAGASGRSSARAAGGGCAGAGAGSSSPTPS